jgi:hypothetical protein
MMKVAFYKVQKGDVWGNLIAGYTGLFNRHCPKYCHCEIGFSYPDGWYWYSSASRNHDGTTGTRWISEPLLLKHPERWDVYDVLETRSIADMIKMCEEEKGKAYDWLGIVGFVTLFGTLNSKNKWYCSEICSYVFTGKWIKRISPIAFYDFLVKGKHVVV